MGFVCVRALMLEAYIRSEVQNSNATSVPLIFHDSLPTDLRLARCEAQ